ncbi:zf-HC2 domain-containing protein [Micromonospora sp. LOL_024]|uniref:zf-HC2 domain-containing protein n=1 Tax=Micromonospora sp. LOL_024 TaxID=3345412 RepID=UPI003A898575
MGCEQWREMLSAQLDGEETPAERPAADEHLAACGDCQGWYERAAAVTRRARLTLTGPGVDLTETVLAALPSAPPRRRLRGRVPTGLRAALGLVGALQLVLGLSQVARGPAAGHQHALGEALASGHLWHESAAWNVAVGAGFLFVATRRARPTGLVPMLTAFVATLVLLSVNDLATSRVDPARLVSHAFLLAGYAIVVAMSREQRAPSGPAGRTGRDGSRWRLTEAEPPTPTGLRLLPPHPGSARYRRDAAA